MTMNTNKDFQNALNHAISSKMTRSLAELFVRKMGAKGKLDAARGYEHYIMQMIIGKL